MTDETFEVKWAKRQAAAQRRPTVKIVGTPYNRVPYGCEFPDWRREEYKPTCHDCGVKLEEYHVEGCDTELCPKCGGQAISCLCDGSLH